MDTSQRSLAGVLKDAGQNIEDILRSEFLLAKAEVREHAIRFKPLVAQVIAGAVLVTLSLLFFLLGGMYLLALYLPLWQAGLVIGVVLAAIGVPMVSSALRKLSGKGTSQ